MSPAVTLAAEYNCSKA